VALVQVENLGTASVTTKPFVQVSRNDSMPMGRVPVITRVITEERELLVELGPKEKKVLRVPLSKPLAAPAAGDPSVALGIAQMSGFTVAIAIDKSKAGIGTKTVNGGLALQAANSDGPGLLQGQAVLARFGVDPTKVLRVHTAVLRDAKGDVTGVEARVTNLTSLELTNVYVSLTSSDGSGVVEMVGPKAAASNQKLAGRATRTFRWTVDGLTKPEVQLSAAAYGSLFQTKKVELGPASVRTAAAQTAR